jgi:hypothetical protein
VNEISQFRRNVQEMFARELGIQVFPGLLEGPNQFGEWLGSLYLQRVQEDPARVAEQQIFLTLRVYAPFSSESVISPTGTYDPSPLEEMADKILAAIARNQTGLGAWYQRVTAIEIDPVTQGVQASLFAYSSNPGVGFNA